MVISQRKSLQDLYDKKVKGLVEELLQSHQMERSIRPVKLFSFLGRLSLCDANLFFNSFTGLEKYNMKISFGTSFISNEFLRHLNFLQRSLLQNSQFIVSYICMHVYVCAFLLGRIQYSGLEL